MKVVIFGGPDDGELKSIPDGELTYPVANVKESTFAQKTSPLGPAIAARWNVVQKRHNTTGKYYPVIILPGLEAWLMKNETHGSDDESA